MVKYIILLALMVNIACCVSLFTIKEIPSFNKDLEEWEQFKQDHGKVYPSSEEEKLRFTIYQSNKRLVEKHNSEHAIGKHNFSMQMNHFGDMLHKEFVATMNGYRHHMRGNFQASNFHGLPDWVQVPDSVDWRDKGAVTPVKDQGHCGSCWAFSSTGALEGQHFRKTGKLVSLSEQNLVDCSTDFGNEGCNGGLMNNAFQYVKVNHGIDTEVSYPYDGEDEQCHFKPVDVGATDTGYMNSPEGDEEALKELVATHGPVSIAIDASHKSFMFYDRGVYSDDDCTSDELDHGVLLVGYGTTDSGEDYWLVKNSWSETWGVDGYVKMARNKDNMCGIASSASIPLV